MMKPVQHTPFADRSLSRSAFLRIRYILDQLRMLAPKAEPINKTCIVENLPKQLFAIWGRGKTIDDLAYKRPLG
jgi:hypothetical protein